MAALDVRDVVMTFGGTRALDDVSLEAEAGCVTGLIGPNGAGKTTLFNVVCGLLAPSSGRVRINTEDAGRLSPTKRARLGLARTFQHLELFTMLSVRENVRVAVETYRGWSHQRTPVNPRVDELLSLTGLSDVADERVTSLPTGRARLVELARALACRPKVLLLDEPASGQTEDETAAFSRLLVRLAQDGLAVVLVEHDMRLVMDVCAQIYVLDYGRLLAAGAPDAIRANEDVRDAYLGADTPPSSPRSRPDEVAPAAAAPPALDGKTATGETLLDVRDLHAGYDGIEALHGVDVRVQAGSVHAVLGPNGAGKTTLLKVIAGLHRPTSGEVTLAGFPAHRASPDELSRAGLCLIPEGRGIFPNLTVRDNLDMMTHTGRPLTEIEEISYGRFPPLSERRTQMAGTLSGGEQQMLAMARALATDPAFLLFDELSMGLAPIIVGQLYELVAQVAATGVTILLVEQFARIVLDVADHATVIAHGEVVGEGAPRDLEHTLTEAYLGG